MNKIIPIADYFMLLASGMGFVQEDFHALTSLHISPPKAEMLARQANGLSAGRFFDEARAVGRVVDTDLIIFERAIKAQQETGESVSINLNSETIFSRELNESLLRVFIKYPDLHPNQICLEITEQGGVPNNFNPQVLINLKSMGFRLALDDYDPFKFEEQARISKFGEYVDIIKFPHEIMRGVRSGIEQSQAYINMTVRQIKMQYPQALIVMEGVRKSDEKQLPTLKALGIDIAQRSSYNESDQPLSLAPA